MKFIELPEFCPSCEKSLRNVRRPARRWQKKAWGLFYCGVGLSVVLAVIFATAAALWPHLYLQHPKTVLVVVVVPFVPAIYLASAAARLPKVVRLKCLHCGWADDFLIEKQG
jgi:FtsH-binding integral membrane protein